MAANISNYAELKILEHSVGKTSWTMPTSCYLTLFTADPTEAVVFTNEVAGGNYARQQTNVSWAAAAAGAIATNADISFPAASGWTGLPVTVTHIGLIDVVTLGAGNGLWYGALSSSKVIASGDVFRITSGSLTLSLD